MGNEFIVFEGVDGSGKTTIARELAQQMGGIYMKTPGKSFEPAREYIDNGAATDAKLFFYLSSVFDASAQIQTTLESHPVVCDRYIFSTIVPHAAYHGRDLEELEEELRPVTSRLLQPDQTILLTVDEDEQLSRLASTRDLTNPTASDEFCRQSLLRRRVREFYERIADREGWLKVDTTNQSSYDVLQQINQFREVEQ